jgi:hypothetical protein
LPTPQTNAGDKKQRCRLIFDRVMAVQIVTKNNIVKSA